MNRCISNNHYYCWYFSAAYLYRIKSGFSICLREMDFNSRILAKVAKVEEHRSKCSCATGLYILNRMQSRAGCRLRNLNNISFYEFCYVLVDFLKLIWQQCKTIGITTGISQKVPFCYKSLLKKKHNDSFLQSPILQTNMLYIPTMTDILL